jgi:hypothetical protein
MFSGEQILAAFVYSSNRRLAAATAQTNFRHADMRFSNIFNLCAAMDGGPALIAAIILCELEMS